VKRPAIGITIGYDEDRPDRHLLREDYVKSVVVSEGLPYVLAPVFDRDIPALLDRLDGLVLTGGSDVDPSIYGEAPHPQLGPVFRERDDFELALCREALRRDLPILAICRGHQVLNVATGGTLIQDIPFQLPRAVNHDPERERWETAHEVLVLPGTKLRALVGRDRIAVNSFHHQAVKDLGRSLVVCARSAVDDLIEGVEATDRRFVLGVQWHPEGFWNQEETFHPLFEALVREGEAR
jgi:putative glutamine amidotransferase